MKFKIEKMTRREFIERSVIGLAGVGFGTSAAGDYRGWPDPHQEQRSGQVPIKRPLGNTGIRLPIVSLGVMNADNPDLVRRAFDLGIRHFDTAHGYQRGRNEEMIGRVLNELGAREKVIIATKAMTPRERAMKSAGQIKQDFIRAAEESLRRLKSDYVDLLYAHDISSAKDVSHPGLVEALALLKEQKKARWVGFSTHSSMASCLEEACRLKFYDVVLTSFNYALSDDEELLASLKKAKESGIGLIAMKTQCSQYWYRDSLPKSKQHYYEGTILHSALLKWVLRHDWITSAVPGCTTFAQLEADWQVAFDLAYSEEEEKFLRDRKVKLSLAYCVQCSQCIPTCPAAVHIPSLMRAHMYLTCYSNPGLTSQALKEMSPGKDFRVCLACDSCRAVCGRGLPLARRVEELKQALA